MREIVEDVERWRAQGKAVVLARVVGVEGSGPRMPGAAMAVSAAGEVAGSVSGGCVEGAVVAEALDLLEEDGKPRLRTFGYSDEEAFAVGLTCGGTTRVFIEALDLVSGPWEVLVTDWAAERPVALAEIVGGPDELTGGKLVVHAHESDDIVGTLGDPDLDRVVARDARGELAAGLSVTRHYGRHGEARAREVDVFIESFAPPPQMIIFGAVDFTAALTKIAKILGYRVTVCDARPVFTTRARFPTADDVVVDWPDRYLAKVGDSLGERDAVCVLTHDTKFDVPAIVAALATDVGYLGAMGSRRTHEERTARLRQAGVDDTGVARVMGPIGLDLGARSPEETAVAICAEIIALRTGRAVLSLKDRAGPIHRDRLAGPDTASSGDGSSGDGSSGAGSSGAGHSERSERGWC